MTKIEYVVCVLKTTPAVFDDDEFDVCSICKREIRFRPYMPKEPPKICVECLVNVVDKLQVKNGD
jgi:hypothetical protein